MGKKTNPRAAGRVRRKIRIRKQIAGTAARPRLSVFRSSRHMYAQIVDDDEENIVRPLALPGGIRQLKSRVAGRILSHAPILTKK